MKTKGTVAAKTEKLMGRLQKSLGSFTIQSFLVTALLAGSLSVQAQTTTATRSDADLRIEDTLVKLALNSPQALRVQHESKLYAYQLKAAKNAWLNLLTISANFNDRQLAGGSNPYNLVYPKYFFGLNIPLGTLLSRTSVKSANESLEIGKLNEEDTRRTIKQNVLTKYKQYKAQSELIALETGAMNDLQTALTQAEDKFRKGTITFDQYNSALRNRNDEQAKIINLRLDQDIIRLDLERMIGVPLDSVVK